MANQKRRRRRKVHIGRLLLVLAVPVLLVGVVFYGVLHLLRPAQTTEKLEEKTVQTKDPASKSADETDLNQDTAQASQPESDPAKQAKEKNNEEESLQQELLQGIREAAAGTVVDVSSLDAAAISSLFYTQEIPADVLSAMEGVTYSSSQDFITPDDLRLVRVLYKNYEGQDCTGELIVNKTIAQDTMDVFEELYEVEYPIAQMVLPDLYGGDDNLSMAANNTSAFSFRLSDGVGIAVHEHSLGLGIDLNPLQNPQVIQENGTTMVFPYSGLQWSDRSVLQDHMISQNDAAYQIFIQHGFSWGGDWSSRPDYMHFEKDYDPSWYRIIG